MNENDANSVTKIRPAQLDDLQEVIELDTIVSGLAKPEYWTDRFDRFTERDGRHLIVAEQSAMESIDPKIAGFIVGEIRAWEFGSDPCGWIFALGVNPEFREQGIGEKLFEAVCDSFKADGANSVRTMIGRKDQLNMSFFRAQGLMGGPFIELEKPLD